MFKGKFITIEGCEGTGKSTQIKLLEKKLKKKIRIKSTREPGRSLGAEQIRKLIFNKKEELESSMLNYLNLFKEKNLSQKYSEKSDLDFVNEKFTIKDHDYYYSNSIARASKTMFKCRSQKINLQATGTEG